MAAKTAGLTAGKDHVERCAAVLTTRVQESADLRRDLAMGEVVLRAVCEM